MEEEYWLHTSSNQYSDKIAIYFEESRISYASYWINVGRTLELLQTKLPNSKIIGLFMENRLDYIYLIHACALTNRICVPINSKLTPKETQFIITDSLIDCVVTSNSYLKKLNEIKELPILNIDQNHEIPLTSVNGKTTINLLDIFLRVYTSGTTGMPKAANISFMNVKANALASQKRLGSEEHDNWLLNLPLFHVGGLSIIFRSCIYGTAITLVKKFDEGSLGKELELYQVNMISVVPTMIRRMMKYPPLIAQLAKIRVILIGGDRTSKELVNLLLNNHLQIYTTYGMTEAFSQIATATTFDLAKNPNSVGYPLEGIEVRIINKDGNICLGEEEGEICVGGTQIISSYLHGKYDKWSENGFHTGDIGYKDEFGRIYVLQRRNDLIISGGENIYPSEIEDVIRGFEGVEDVIVIGLEDDEWNFIPVALIESEKDLSIPLLLDHCDNYLARYKIPKKIVITPNLPRSTSGKIIREKVKSFFH